MTGMAVVIRVADSACPLFRAWNDSFGSFADELNKSCEDGETDNK
jgi:hypothetical protein